MSFVYITSALSAFICGAFLASQKIINASLGKHIGSIESSFINHLVGTIFAGFILIIGIRTGTFFFKGIPFYYFLGGIIGVLVVALANYAIPRIGAMSAAICLTFCQLAASSIIDHFGFFSSDIFKFNIYRCLGMILIFCGMIIVTLKTREKE